MSSFECPTFISNLEGNLLTMLAVRPYLSLGKSLKISMSMIMCLMISDFGSYEGQKDINQGWNENQNNDKLLRCPNFLMNFGFSKFSSV